MYLYIYVGSFRIFELPTYVYIYIYIYIHTRIYMYIYIEYGAGCAGGGATRDEGERDVLLDSLRGLEAICA